MHNLRVGLASEPESFPAKEFLKSSLGSQVFKILDFSLSALKQDYDPQDVADCAAEALSKGDCDCCILLSVSGSGLQMYANKHDFVRASTAFNPQSVASLVKDLDINMIDIPTHISIDTVAEVAIRFVESFEERHYAVAG